MTDPDDERVLEAVIASELLSKERPAVVMLSGGCDSVCLLDACATLRPDAVRALHVNYGLRDEADADENYCRELCEDLEVELEVLQASRPADVGNTQAWARDVRYAAAEESAVEDDAWIVAGHTATDQVETILYRLAASPGRRALLGMTPVDGRLLRPLLGITRAQTKAYCLARGLWWQEDESNDTDAYARGRVRNKLVPELCAVHPAAEDNVLRTAHLLREETELLEGLVDAELGGEPSIALERLATLPRALRRLVVTRLAEDVATGYVPQAGERVDEILALGRRGGHAELHVGGLVSAVLDGGRLSMVAIEPHYRAPGTD